MKLPNLPTITLCELNTDHLSWSDMKHENRNSHRKTDHRILLLLFRVTHHVLNREYLTRTSYWYHSCDSIKTDSHTFYQQPELKSLCEHGKTRKQKHYQVLERLTTLHNPLNTTCSALGDFFHQTLNLTTELSRSTALRVETWSYKPDFTSTDACAGGGAIRLYSIWIVRTHY